MVWTEEPNTNFCSIKIMEGKAIFNDIQSIRILQLNLMLGSISSSLLLFRNWSERIIDIEIGD